MKQNKIIKIKCKWSTFKKKQCKLNEQVDWWTDGPTDRYQNEQTAIAGFRKGDAKFPQRSNPASNWRLNNAGTHRILQSCKKGPVQALPPELRRAGRSWQRIDGGGRRRTSGPWHRRGGGRRWAGGPPGWAWRAVAGKGRRQSLQ